jgi:hypothetical protein
MSKKERSGDKMQNTTLELVLFGRKEIIGRQQTADIQTCHP